MGGEKPLLRILGLPLVCLMALALAAQAAGDAAPDKKTSPDSLDIYLLIGQSNMAGRGVVETEDTQPHPRVMMLDESNQWAPAVEPLHFDKPRVAGVGPGRAFGVAMAERQPSRKIGLVPCAVGGTSIRLWTPGAYDEVTGSHPYDDMIPRMKIALERGTLRGVLWHQGESDSDMGLDGSYYPALKELIERLRAEFNAPAVPVTIGQLAQFSPWPEGRQRVDAAHRTAAEELPYVGFVVSDELEPHADGVHFDAESSRELGRRFAAAMMALQAEIGDTPPNDGL